MLHRVRGVLRLLLPFVARELREQYAGSSLGLLWSFVQPTLYVLLYWWVFAEVLQLKAPGGGGTGQMPFLVFLLSGLLPWFAFQDGLVRAANSVLARRDVVKHLHFPLLVFPLAAVMASFAVHMSAFVMFLVGLFLWGGPPSLLQVLGIAGVMALQLALTLALGIALAALTVYIRDLLQAIGILLQILFYTSPILYSMERVPAALHSAVMLNPFTLLAEAYHGLVLEGRGPAATSLLGMALLFAALLWGARRLFKGLQPGFSDVL